jgi:signal peptidase
MLKTIYFIFGTFIAIIGVLLVVSSLPVTGNYKVMVVQSGSMEPAIKTGGIVLVKPIAEYKVGDVISFLNGKNRKQSITHRIAEIKEDKGRQVYVTKGDANEERDPEEILKRSITGKVLFTVPYLGYAINAAKKPFGFIAIIAIPAFIIIFDEAKKIKNEVTKIRQSKKTASRKEEDESGETINPEEKKA